MKVSFLFICCVLLVVLYTCFQSDARSFRRRGGYSVRGSLRRGRFRGYSVRGSLRRGRFGGYSVRGSLRRGIKRIKTGIRNVGRKIKSGADFVAGAAKGSVSMAKAYKDLRDANWKNSDKYFHARGNSDAAKHGPGGKWAAKVISNARENIQGAMGGSKADSAADQAANRWGRNGGNPNKYRPKDLPKKYKK